jgi:hypothetical protein
VPWPQPALPFHLIAIWACALKTAIVRIAIVIAEIFFIGSPLSRNVGYRINSISK